jgi:hypothetical protein
MPAFYDLQKTPHCLAELDFIGIAKGDVILANGNCGSSILP